MLRARQPGTGLFASQVPYGSGPEIQGLTFLFGGLMGATGGAITADLSATLDTLTLSADATVLAPITADLSATLADLTLSADATIANPVTADLSVTLEPATLSADATMIVNVTADLTATLEALTLASDVSVGAVPVTADLTATLADATLASDVTVSQAIIIDDTHDGEYLKKKLKAERKALKRRRQQVLDLYERLVEGKEPPPPEVVAIIEDAGIVEPPIAPRETMIEYDRMIAALERAVELHRQLMLERDDEEVLLLI